MNRQEMFTQELKDLLKKYNANFALQEENPCAYHSWEQMIVEFDWVEGELHDTDIVLGRYFDGDE